MENPANAPASPHKAGFVNIIGKPNVGKSTLMNRIMGEKFSIITPKAQTTRHRIMGIINGEDYQIVYSDTPGIITPQYELHKSMMRWVSNSLEDADIVLWVSEIGEKHVDEELRERLRNLEVPIFLLLNKIDQANEDRLRDKKAMWLEHFSDEQIFPISALEGTHTDTVLEAIREHLPEHPPYFPKDEWTDKPARFFASEIVREKIFTNYKQEIPYSSEVVISEFKEKEEIIVIRAEIMVERKSQKGILIGKGGEALKKVGVEARKDLEAFFGQKVFLETHVKVEPDWRQQERKLRRFGYMQ